MFAPRPVALALTSFNNACTVSVLTIVFTLASLLASQPLRDAPFAGALLGCSAVDVRPDRVFGLAQMGRLMLSEESALARPSTQTESTPADRAQLTTCQHVRVDLARAQSWLALPIAPRPDAVAKPAWQRLSALYQRAHSGLAVLRL